MRRRLILAFKALVTTCFELFGFVLNPCGLKVIPVIVVRVGADCNCIELSSGRDGAADATALLLVLVVVVAACYLLVLRLSLIHI